MQTRLTTPGFALALITALIVGAIAVARIVSNHNEAFVDIPNAPSAGAQTALSSFNPAMVYQARVQGVVMIDANFGTASISGSGFVVDTDGHILTASHVIVDYQRGGTKADAIYVEFNSHDRIPATLVGYDAFSDIAVLKVNPSEVKLRPVPLGNSDRVVVGEPVAAIGAPFDFQESLSTGIVSATHRVVGSQINIGSNISEAIQTDVAINKGNSGGPLFNARGDVIGINQQIRTTSGASDGVAFSLPINMVKRSMRQLIDTGEVHYAWLGLSTATVTPQLARAYGLRATYGALVAQANGPAATAGLSGGNGATKVFNGITYAMGDQIVSIASARVKTREDVNRIADRIDVGQRVEVEFYRDGELRSTTLTAAEKTIS